MTLLLGHSEAMCPKPRYLKHLLGVAGFGGYLFCGIRALGAIWDEFLVGLGVSWGSLGEGLVSRKGLWWFSLDSLRIFFFAQLYEPTQMHPQKWCIAAVLPYVST